MELNEHIANICKELQLPMFSEHHHELSNRAAKESWKYSEYLLEILKLEANNRAVRSRATLTKMAGFPTIKTLEQFVPQGQAAHTLTLLLELTADR